MKLLIVEDNLEQAKFLQVSFQQEGHEVVLAYDGQTGLISAFQENFDLIITDRLMPKLDGLKMLKALRASEVTTPVLILSALDSVDQRVEGLRSGGNDYLIKPFAFSELLARAEILANQNVTVAPSNLVKQLDTLVMNLSSREVRRDGKVIPMNNREFQLLDFFLSNIGKTITRTMLLEKVWGIHFDPQTNVVDVYVSRVRKKIDIKGSVSLLHTVRGAGYVMESRP